MVTLRKLLHFHIIRFLSATRAFGTNTLHRLDFAFHFDPTLFIAVSLDSY